MRFFLDANMPHSALMILSELGQKGIHAADIGLGGAADEEILAYAKKARSILITKDLDFGNLIVLSKKSTNGIIILRLPYTFTASQINSALRTFLKAAVLSRLRNAITVVELGRYKVRKI